MVRARNERRREPIVFGVGVVRHDPGRLHLERVATGQWGSAMWDQSHAHGPDLWRICVVQSPLLPKLDENATKRALNDNVDAIRGALIAHVGLPDSGGTDQALDVGEHILTEYDGQGEEDAGFDRLECPEAVGGLVDR